MGLQQRFGAEIEPKDPSFKSATPTLRKRYFDACGALILDELSKQLGKGIGRNGRMMKARIQPVLADGADGPVMEPHYSLSRVITLADYMARADGLTLFWHAGTGHKSHKKAKAKGKKAAPFGTILDYHAAGEVPHAPVRDVRLCKARIANVQRAGEAWWADHRPKTKAAPKPQPKPTPAPPADWKSKLPTLAEYQAIHGPHVPDTSKDNAPVKGTPVKLKLPKGPLKGPGLIDTAALKSQPLPPPKPAPIIVKPLPVPVAPKAPPAPVFVPKPPAPKPIAAPVPKPPAPKPAPAPVVAKPPPAPAPVSPNPRYTDRIAAAKREEAARAATWTPKPQSEFREFNDTGRLTEEWGQAAYKHWADTLPEDEKRALKVYATDNYKWMNAILRKQPLVGDQALPYGMSEAGARDYVERAAAGLRAGKVPEDIVAYRGVRDSAAMGFPDPAALVRGQELTIDSFASTSLKQSKAAQFAAKDGDPRAVVIQINTPKGSTGGYLNAAELSQYDDERELLLPPGVRLRFVGMGKSLRPGGPAVVPVAIFERVE